MVNGSGAERQKTLEVLAKYGISDNKVVLWGKLRPFRIFMSESCGYVE